MAYIPFLHSVEFYVIMTVVAAAVIALCVRPSDRGRAQTHTVGGFLCEGIPTTEPALHIECLDNGNVLIRRTGVHGIGATGALSIAIKQIGFDLQIDERLTPGRPLPAAPNQDIAATVPSQGIAGAPDRGIAASPVTEAIFILTFLAPEWYHIRYTCDPTDRFAAFTLHVRPGLTTTIPLRR